MTPKNSEKISWGPIIVGYIIFLFIWLHYTHLASWCSGNYTEGLIALTNGDINPYRVLTEANWPITVLGFSGRSVSGINLAFYALMETVTDPFNLKGTVLSNGGLGLFGITLFYGVWLWSQHHRHELYKQDAAGKEHGDAHFENLDDITEFMMKKAMFYWRDFANKWGNPNLKLRIAALFNKNVTTPSSHGWAPLKGKDAIKLFYEQKENDIEDPNILLGTDSTGRYVKYALDNSYFNSNVSALVVGKSGGGKTFRFIKPTLATMSSSYVITDPSGEIMEDLGLMLLEHGYKVKLFSTSDMKHSNCYNPFDYVYDFDGTPDQTKVAIFISTFMANANDVAKNAKGGDNFWQKAPQAFMTAAVYYCIDFLPVEQRNMTTILKLTQKGKADESASSSKTELDKLFEDAKKINPKSKCFSSYATFKLAPAKTANSILISLGVDLDKFADDNVFNMTTTDYLCKRDKKTGLIKEYLYSPIEKKKPLNERRPIRSSRNIDLDKIGDEKTAVFINIPQANSAYNFLVSMMYAQLFDILYTRAEKVSPKHFHVYDKFGQVLSSQYNSEEHANRFIDLYKHAEVKTVEFKNDNADVSRYYLYNENATLDESDPEAGKGYLREVHSEKVGKNLISRYQKAVVKRGALKLPVHVKCLLDEFANIGTIPNFEKILSTARKYEISATIVVQSFVQLETMFDKAWETIVGNCSTLIYLGATEYKTQEYMVKLLGNATARTVKESMSKQTNGGSTSASFERIKRELMTIDEVADVGNKDETKEIVILNGSQKFLLNKLDFSKHPHFKETGTYSRDRKITSEFLEKHYKCSDKHTVFGEEDEEIAVRQESINNGGSGSTVNGRKPPFGKTQPLRNPNDLGNAFNIDINNRAQVNNVFGGALQAGIAKTRKTTSSKKAPAAPTAEKIAEQAKEEAKAKTVKSSASTSASEEEKQVQTESKKKTSASKTSKEENALPFEDPAVSVKEPETSVAKEDEAESSPAKTQEPAKPVSEEETVPDSNPEPKSKKTSGRAKPKKPAIPSFENVEKDKPEDNAAKKVNPSEFSADDFGAYGF